MTILVGVIMGSKSDWDTMQHAATTLDKLGIAHETRVISAHRTPDALTDYCRKAKGRGLEVIIAAAGGAAALPGAIAALTPLPVLGVPMKAWSLDGLDSLLSMAQMPAGIPVGTLAIGKAGAINSAVLAASIIAKVARDKEMEALDSRYPVYGLARHKGYPTAFHLAALREHGPSPIHRMSFAPCRQGRSAS